MSKCKACGEDVDELLVVLVEGRKRKVCESCAEEVAEGEAIAEASEAVVQQMMGFTGRR